MPVGRWRCRQDGPFLWYFLLGIKRKYRCLRKAYKTGYKTSLTPTKEGIVYRVHFAVSILSYSGYLGTYLFLNQPKDV